MELWIARDESSDLNLYHLKPKLKKSVCNMSFWQPQKFGIEYPICSDLFPEVTFENSPKKIKIEIIEE